MTEADVRRLEPDASRPDHVDTLRGGASCLLALPHVAVDGSDYRACFFFQNAKLVQVILTASAEPGDSQFRGVVTALRAKYGKELSLDQTAMGYQANWLTADGVNIAVVFLNRYTKLLNISYQIRLKAESGNL